MSRIIRWGILGCGRIARKFAADLKLVPDARLVAAGSRSLANARQFAQDFQIPNAFGSYEELVEFTDIDIIYVASPHSHHYEHTILCLHHNKAVLCEKAFAVNTEEAREMIRMAREKKLFLMEALWTKFLPHYTTLQQLLKDRLIGDISSVLINFGFKPNAPVPARLFDPALAGGTLLDIGIYNVFMAMSILGKPDIIYAHMSPSEKGVDEQCAVLFKYKNGAMAQLFSSFLVNMDTEAHIHGSKGRIKLTHRFYAPESTIEYYPALPDTREVIDLQKDAGGFGYEYEARHVTACLQQDLTESPLVTHAETIERMEVLDEIRKKAGIKYPSDI